MALLAAAGFDLGIRAGPKNNEQPLTQEEIQ